MQDGRVVVNKFINGVNTDFAEDSIPNGFLSNGHNIKFTNDDNKQGIVQKQESYIKQLNGYGENLKPLAAKSLNNVIYIVSYNPGDALAIPPILPYVEYGTYPSLIIPISPTESNVIGLSKQYIYAPLPNYLIE